MAMTCLASSGKLTCGASTVLGADLLVLVFIADGAYSACVEVLDQAEGKTLEMSKMKIRASTCNGMSSWNLTDGCSCNYYFPVSPVNLLSEIVCAILD